MSSGRLVRVTRSEVIQVHPCMSPCLPRDLYVFSAVWWTQHKVRCSLVLKNLKEFFAGWIRMTNYRNPKIQHALFFHEQVVPNTVLVWWGHGSLFLELGKHILLSKAQGCHVLTGNSSVAVLIQYLISFAKVQPRRS